MTGKSDPEVLTGDLARSLLAAAPPWARGMQVRREADGRLVLAGESDDCFVWVQPKKAWSKMTARDDRNPGNAALNYGLQMQEIGSHAGQLETNDPRFGRELLTGSTGRESPMPDGPSMRPSGASTSGLIFPAALIAVGLVAAALIARLKRRVS